MTAIEIVLLVIGVIAFVLSFIIPEKLSGESAEGTLTEKQLDKLVEEKVEEAKSKISESVDDAVSYATEKTNRSMERLSNEKIMAISEFAETVINDIHKNHEEVVFMYDMLNDKQTTLKNTVREVEQTAKSAEKAANEAARKAKEIPPAEDNFIPLTIVTEKSDSSQKIIESVKEEEKKPFTGRKDPRGEKAKATARNKAKENDHIIPAILEADDEDERNRNAEILELHNAGKSNMAIARELGMGVGEVKLVVDLFKDM